MTQYEQGKVYHIIIGPNTLKIDGKEIDIKNESCMSFYAMYPKNTEINLKNTLLPFIKLPRSFKKMLKIWKEQMKNGLCYD